ERPFGSDALEQPRQLLLEGCRRAGPDLDQNIAGERRRRRIEPHEAEHEVALRRQLATLAEVAHYPDDAVGPLALGRLAELLADRIPLAVDRAREVLIDDDGIRGQGVVGRLKPAAG